MSDRTQQMPPVPPPPPSAGNGGDTEKASWWKRSVPVWAVLIIAILAIGLGAASAGTDEEADTEVGAAGNSEESARLSEQIDELEGQLAERDETIQRLESELEEADTTTTEATTTTTTAPTTTTTTAPPQPVEAARFSGGSTGTETGDFTVNGTWELQYNISGGAGLIIEITDSASGTRVDSIAPDPGTGSSTFRQGGTYYLKVETFGADAWEIVIVDMP